MPGKKISFLVNLTIIIYLILYFAAINLVVLNRFWQFEAYYFDHGIYDGALWQAAHFQIPLIDHLGHQFLNQLGDHFSPSMYLLAPLYWITRAYEPILIIQNLFITLSAIIIYIVAKKRFTKSLIPIAILIAYTLSLGLQNAIISNLHPEILALFPLALTFYFLERKKWRAFWLTILLFMGFKETFISIGIFLAVYLFLQKEIRRGTALLSISLVYYVLVIRFIMPGILEAPYLYAPILPPPVRWAYDFFIPVIKTQTLFISFVTFGFLPLAAFSFLPVILQDYFLRFVVSNSSGRSDLGLHYNAVPVLLLAYGAILGASFLCKKFPLYKKIINYQALLIIILAIFLHYKLQGPLGLSYNRAFYAHTKNLEFLHRFINKIPATRGILMAQNNFAPRLTHSHRVILLRLDYEKWAPAVIALDRRPGQNPNNYWPLPPIQFEELSAKLTHDKNYRQINVTDNQMIFLRRI